MAAPFMESDEDKSIEPVGQQGDKVMQKKRRAAKKEALAAPAKPAKRAMKKKASFRRKHGRRRAKKVEEKESPKTYAGYDLVSLQIPEEALPQCQGKGKHSYTVKNKDNTAVIEVLLRNKAFYCKRAHASLSGASPGQIGWKTVGGVQAAWRAAKERVGWDL